MKINEHGRLIAVCAKEDIELASYYEIILKPPQRDLPEIRLTPYDGIEMPLTDLVVDEVVVFPASTYLTYITKRDDITISGEWKVRLYVEFDNGARGFYGSWVSMVVEP